MKSQMSQARELVLRTIRKRPDMAIGKIAFVTGLSETAVSKQVAKLVAEDLIYSVKLPQRPGRLRTATKGYRHGKNPVLAESSKDLVPGQWDVLAYFFGRIAEPAAA